ncbi:MAG: twin-arginine translocation signal domain-containing protein [Sedimentisphaerales bacterium]|nr:twin-arginine translocation signal domain-containing protein [Sedimentisphaerales bacterium]
MGLLSRRDFLSLCCLVVVMIAGFG